MDDRNRVGVRDRTHRVALAVAHEIGRTGGMGGGHCRDGSGLGLGDHPGLVLCGLIAPVSISTRRKARAHGRTIGQAGSERRCSGRLERRLVRAGRVRRLDAARHGLAFDWIGRPRGIRRGTWATELGSLAKKEPRSVVTRQRVPAGTSGGVTATGTLASLGGAAFVALHPLALGWTVPVALGALVGGFVGSIVDSFAGATLQARYWCTFCDTNTERRVHDCGNITELRDGARWMTNDAVNALATAAGAAVSCGVALGTR